MRKMGSLYSGQDIGLEKTWTQIYWAALFTY